MNEQDILAKLTDPATERNVNAVICQYGREAFDDIDDLVTPSTFVINTNQIVYKCLRHIFNNANRNETIKIDNSILMATAKNLGYDDFFVDPKEIKLIDRLFVMPVEATNARKLAAMLRKLEIKRLLVQQLHMGLDDIENIPNDAPIEEVLSKVEGRILDFTSLLNDESKQASHIGEDLDEYVDHLLSNPCESVGISTGYPLLDKAIGGLRRGAIQLIAARAKAGKSMLSINIGMHIARKLGIKVLYLDTEMNKSSQHIRMLANLSDVDIDDIETGKFGKNKLKKSRVLAAKEELKKMPFTYAPIAGKPIEEIMSIIRKWIRTEVGFDENGNTNDCVVIYDYIKLMDSNDISKNMQETMAMGYLCMALNNMFVKYDVACLAFAQQNREGLDSTSLSTVAGSDRLSWYCASVSTYGIKASEDLEECGDKYGTRKLVPKIARFGEGIGEGNYINFHFIGKKAQIKQGKDYFTIKDMEKNGTDYDDLDKVSGVLDGEAPWEE